MPAKRSRPRIPLPATAEVVGDKRTVQVNHCRMPDCVNFGVPALHEGVKPGPSPRHKDPHYTGDTTGSGEPAIRCKSCNTHPPLKSNASIADEIIRLIDVDGIRTREETTACRNRLCENSARPIAFHRSCYHKKGKVTGRGQQYRCEACGRYVLVSDPVLLHQNHQALGVDVFTRVANKSPMRRAVNGAGLKSNKDYYRILDFIHSRCRNLSGTYDRALIDGRLTLPTSIDIHADAQEYALNWVSRLDRRNVELQAYCSVDRGSGFIFGLHSNFDPTVDPFEINSEAAKHGEMDVPEAFRKHARYWLVEDELRAGRSMKKQVAHSIDLSAQIQSMYAQAASRADVEDIELHHFDDEPEKAVSWMTRDDSLGEDQIADLFLGTGLTHSDNVFQKVRRLTNTLERPISTPSGLRTVWNGYAPYKPEIVQKYLSIFRVVHNFVFVGKEDPRTPAMRLGLAKEPLEWADILWPRQRVPRPKRTRRRGKRLMAA